MPIYEYECGKCRKRTSILTMRVSEKVDAVCRHCGSTAMSRLMSRFAMPRSEEARMEALGDPSTFSDFDESDPKSVAKVMRRLGSEMGDELGEGDIEEAIEEIERGGDGGDSGDDGL